MELVTTKGKKPGLEQSIICQKDVRSVKKSSMEAD